MELDVRGAFLWQVRKYMVQLGGKEQPDGSFTGSGWSATLTELEYHAMGSVFPRVIIQWTGDPAVYERLRLRVTRVGG